MRDEVWMGRAIEIAKVASGRTSPNPVVGAVVVKDGFVIGIGAHLRAGEPHAEVHALRMAGDRAKGAAVYVTLEPCSHTGRTPPCAEALVHAGVKRVVVGMLDPNPLVAGRGVEHLRSHGIDVTVGVMEVQARAINETFIYSIVKKLPWTMMKTAMTLDGKVATVSRDSRWISGESSRRYVHELRDGFDAIITGVGTVMADDPQLTVRLEDGEHRRPCRVVMDSELRADPSSRVYETRSAPTLVVCGARADGVRRRVFEERGVVVVEASDENGRVDLKRAFGVLYERGIASALVEAGPTLCGALLDHRLVNAYAAFVAPKVVGGLAPTPVAGNGVQFMKDAFSLRQVEVRTFDSDVLIEGRIDYPIAD